MGETGIKNYGQDSSGSTLVLCAGCQVKHSCIMLSEAGSRACNTKDPVLDLLQSFTICPPASPLILAVSQKYLCVNTHVLNFVLSIGLYESSFRYSLHRSSLKTDFVNTSNSKFDQILISCIRCERSHDQFVCKHMSYVL